ncbi:MAG: acetylglutamate kinase [Leptospirales bacterium]|nr:acetylglutamate kinase [Leptospirales bacterium]
MQQENQRAQVLLEALPYIRRFRGRTLVIKFGGAAMESPDLQHRFARDITLLQMVGIKPVIVHGGGPQINRLLKDLNIPTQFVDGHRITDQASMEVVEMVLCGRINKEIVALINAEGGRAAGISGKDGGLAVAQPHSLQRTNERGQLEEVSLGLVGTVSAEDIDPSLIRALEQNDFVPVIAPVAADRQGRGLNVNADTMAGAIASALRAEKLILLTDTPGVLAEGKTVTGLSPRDVERMKNDGTISGGMIPKVDCCLLALLSGVKRTHIIDGRVPHALLLEVFTDRGVGTLISNDFDKARNPEHVDH